MFLNEKTPFSSIVTHLTPQTVLHIDLLVLICSATLKKGEGEATFHKGRGENSHMSQQLLSMIEVSSESWRVH